MEVKKIVIIGNSVALRNRPHTKEQSLNYGQLINQHFNTKTSDTLYLVENLAFGRATMRDLHKIQDQIINAYGDLYIINIGVSDAATREMPRWFADILNRRKENLTVKIAKGIFALFIKPNRTFLVKIRGKRAWSSAKFFQKRMNKLIYDIQHNTSGKIIVLSLNKPDDRIEKIVPGTAKNYEKFNDILKDICRDKEISYLDLDDLDAKIAYPDGTHFSEEGNRIVAQKIIQLINERGII